MIWCLIALAVMATGYIVLVVGWGRLLAHDLADDEAAAVGKPEVSAGEIVAAQERLEQAREMLRALEGGTVDGPCDPKEVAYWRGEVERYEILLIDLGL